MKKNHLLAIISCVLTLTGCNKDDSQSASNIKDEIFRSYLLQNFDTNEDGKFSKEETAAAKIMDVNSLGIKSIKGIEIFHAIETLKCTNNQIEELNVIRNKELTYLDCSYNDIFMVIQTPRNAKLKHLNYSNNKRIDFYSPNGETELEYLDLSNTGSSDGSFHLRKLKYLNCSGIGIYYLNVISCTELTHLDFSENKMSENNPVDLTKNTKLNTLWAEKTPGLKYIYLTQGQKIEDLKTDTHVKIMYK